MKLAKLLGAASLVLFTSAVNATVWHPTSVDADFIQIDPVISTQGGSIALSDDSDASFTAPLVKIVRVVKLSLPI